MPKLKITFWGGVGSVTGANFLLENENIKIMIDCGLFQGLPQNEIDNEKSFPYDPKSIDFLFLTHAHMDHIGRVPKLVKEGFKGVIYSTEETKEIAEIMFRDALKVMKMNGKEIYEDLDVNEALSLWKTLPYYKRIKVREEFAVTLKDAGHILGSSMYEFDFLGKKIVFTGDLGNSPTPLLKDTDLIENADYLVIDSVYGDRNHEPKELRDQKFRQIVLDTIKKKGALVIPAFSLERTQVILYELNNLVEENLIPEVPVFLDSPLGSKVTEIYKRHFQNFNSGVRKEINEGDKIFDFPKLKIITNSFESKNIVNTPNPKIIIAGSGMSTGGRVIWHEKIFLPDPKSTILLMGYQSVGTLGRLIQSKPKMVEIKGEKIPVRARIENISGFSSHKDSDGIVETVSNTSSTLKKVFVVMGEMSASTFLVQRLRDELDVPAIYPEKGQAYYLD